MKEIIIFTMFLFCFLLKPSEVVALELPIQSKNVILYNLDEGAVLYEKSADEVVSIASLTKIMTALIVLEISEDLEEKVTLTSQDFQGLAEANASLAHFFVGEEVTIRDLLYGLLFPSGADAAQALTRIFGGKEYFVGLMNRKAMELGLTHTHFQNETGLDEEGHYSTVREVATFFQYAIRNEQFREILETPKYQTSNHNKTYESTVRKFIQKNSLSMDYLLGGKTGTTENAGLCLASFAYANNTNYLLVTVGAPNDWQTPYHLFDAKEIYEYFMNHFEKKVLVSKNESILELKAKYATTPFLFFSLEEDVLKYVSKEFQKEDVSISYEGIEEVTPWMKQGDFLGILTISYLGEKLLSKEVFLSQSVTFDFFKFMSIYYKEFFLLFLLLLFCFIIKIMNKKCR